MRLANASLHTLYMYVHIHDVCSVDRRLGNLAWAAATLAIQKQRKPTKALKTIEKHLKSLKNNEQQSKQRFRILKQHVLCGIIVLIVFRCF